MSNQCIANESRATKQQGQLPSTNLDSLWSYLIFEKGGCLTGGQYIRNNKFGSEGSTMSLSKEWNDFFKVDQKELSTFLISKITKDMIETGIHTCPFYFAIEGEVAVYALQRIYLVNWYDFDEFKEYQNRETTDALDSPQSWLQEILKDTKRRRTLIKCWETKAGL